MRARLQKKAEASWIITYKCVKAKQGCPFELQLRHAAGSSTVEVWEMEKHQGHDPCSPDERAQLKMDPEVEVLVRLLLECGVKPYQAWWRVTAQRGTQGLPSGGSLLAASDARFSLTLGQVYAVRKKMQRDAGYGLTSDAAAVAAQMEELGKRGWVRFYQPLKERSDGTGTASDGQPLVLIQREDGLHQPLMIVLQTQFQGVALGQLGGRVISSDAAYGTNGPNFPLQAATVRCCFAACQIDAGRLASIRSDQFK